MNRGARKNSLLLAAWLIFTLPAQGLALEPEEILVLANRNAAKSVGLAKYYLEKRKIPKRNLLPLWVTDKEWCSREEYDKKVRRPVQEHLRKNDPERRIRCILIMYGFPLKVSPTEMTDNEKEEVESLRKKMAKLNERIKTLAGEEREEALKEVEAMNARIGIVQKNDESASLDSETAFVLKEDYALSGWIPNPFFAGFRGRVSQEMRRDVLAVARLDGPSEGIVKRVIDDSLEAEKSGLKGTAYFDARWPNPTEEKDKDLGLGYGFYDRSIHRAAELVSKSGKMQVVVNDKQALFSAGECPNAALYCGWYSLGKYIDAFQWSTGAVGYHIASGECSTLKQPGSTVWCKRMLEEGVAGTTGPVYEPYVQAFPIPELFFQCLLEGSWTLAECYALSQPFWSWRMVLLGDPLYNPFKNKK